MQYKVRTSDLRFAFTSISGKWDVPSYIQSSLNSVVQNAQDRERNAWEKDMRQTGHLLRHMEVLFIGKHPDKGMHGSIIDFHLLSSEGTPNLMEDRSQSMENLLESAELTIKIDVTSRISRAYASQVVERQYVF